MYLHQLGIAHLDVKEQNVVYVRGYAKLIDFGGVYDNTFDGEMTVSSTTAYNPPEMLTSKSVENYSFGADIWALGIVIIKLLNKSDCLWSQNTPKGILEDIKQGRHLSLIPESCSSKIKDIIVSCLAM
jgi:serine/threonine protein kinase